MRLPWDSVLKCDSAALDAVASGGSTLKWLVGGTTVYFQDCHVSVCLIIFIYLPTKIVWFGVIRFQIWGGKLVDKGALSPQNYYLTEFPQQNKTDEAKRPSDFFKVSFSNASRNLCVSSLFPQFRGCLKVLRDIDFLFSLLAIQGHFLNEDYSDWRHGRLLMEMFRRSEELKRHFDASVSNRIVFSCMDEMIRRWHGVVEPDAKRLSRSFISKLFLDPVFSLSLVLSGDRYWFSVMLQDYYCLQQLAPWTVGCSKFRELWKWTRSPAFFISTIQTAFQIQLRLKG